MLLHPDCLRNCSFGMLSPPVLCESASYFTGGSRGASGRAGLLGPYIPSSNTTGHASCCATFAGCVLTLLPRLQHVSIFTKTCIFNIVDIFFNSEFNEAENSSFACLLLGL